MKNQQYKELEAKETQLRVKVDKAKALIASWMDGDDDEDDQVLPTALAKGAGLGSVKAPVVAPNSALAKLKRKKQYQKPKIVAPAASSDEEESRTKRSKKTASKSALDSYKKKR